MPQTNNRRRGISNELREPDYHDTACMYDDMTGLISYYLFEDRLQTALNYETHKDIRIKRSKIVVVCINIDNISYFDEPEMIIREMAARMKIYFPLNYTIARGIRYTFWVMMPSLSSFEEIDIELGKIRTIFRTPLKNNERALTSIGVSFYDGEDIKAKGLVEQAVIALQRAQTQGENNMLFYSRN
ncbi:MAG: GGDEF domain-containing protein [Alphaproteobacteria bacterium]|nr:GGDEF domain-containing protein [Alphaproteobacteria bacterium]